METSKKIIMIGISLMLVTLTIVGCTTQNSELKPPIFKINEVAGRWAFLGDGNYTEDGNYTFAFPLYIENPNNETIQLQLIYLNLMDGSGNILMSFTPKVDPNFECYFGLYNQIGTEQFSLDAHENITLSCYRPVSNDSVSKYCWDYLCSLAGASISGLYKLNGDLQWFNSKISIILIPI
jgi:hypothetical protein